LPAYGGRKVAEKEDASAALCATAKREEAEPRNAGVAEQDPVFNFRWRAVPAANVPVIGA